MVGSKTLRRSILQTVTNKFALRLILGGLFALNLSMLTEVDICVGWGLQP